VLVHGGGGLGFWLFWLLGFVGGGCIVGESPPLFIFSPGSPPRNREQSSTGFLSI